LTDGAKFRVWWVVALFAATAAGCGGGVAVVEQPQYAPPPQESSSLKTPDQALLKDALQGQSISPVEAANLSDRMLADEIATFQDDKNMARLEILLYKALKTQDKQARPRLLRNLGIIHYHQKQYKRARQELQQANELNPKDARTHFYLARLFAHQSNIYLAQGKKQISQQQAKRADIEMQHARKLEPSNPLYRQNLAETLQQERGK